jgi:SGT1 protein
MQFHQEPLLFGAATDGDDDDFGGLINLDPALGTDSVVEYSIYADSTASVAALESLRERLLAMACELVADHIWHRSGFNLCVRQPATGEPYLYGRTDYGEHVDDEWLIVYLLMQATTIFAAESLSICVTDGDGEFILIQAAMVIPPFLSPANSQHRVWLHGGKVHLVLPDHAATQQPGNGSKTSRLTAAEGLAALRQAQPAGSTAASAEVQQAVNQRLAEYPAKLQTDRHYARCYLPRAAALVLRRLPSYIAPAVLAYCSRESNEVAVAGAMQRLGGGGCVEDRVRFTRHLYAQLLTAAPVASAKAFPAHWCAADGAPHLTTTARLKAAELGQKVAMGLEILYWRSAALHNSSSSSSSDSTSEAADSAYSSAAAVPASFVHSLEERGYFEGELQGSKRYREKLALAAQFLQQRDASSAADTSDDDQLLLGLAAHMGAATATATATAGDAAEVFARVTEPDDSESWMEVLPSELEQLLQQHNQEPLWSAAAVELAAGEEAHSAATAASAAASAGGSDTAAAAAAASEQLNDMVRGMHAFMDDSESGLEGAEVPAVGSSISFDVEKFMRLLDGIDDDVAEDDASSDDGANSDTADTTSTTAGASAAQRKRSVRVGHVQGGRAVHEMLDDDSDDELSAEQQQESDSPPEPAQTEPADDMAFMQQYVAALEEQLDESSMGESFRQARLQRAAETLARAKVTGPMPLPPRGLDSDDSDDESTAAAVADYWNESSGGGAAAAPVNVDLNMVQQLLESFAAQQGQPGPVSSLLREMGISIPTATAATDAAADDDDMVVE